MSYSLIADSGLQFIRFTLDLEDINQFVLRFAAKVNIETYSLDIDFAISSLESENMYFADSLHNVGIDANLNVPVDEKQYSNLPGPISEDNLFSVSDIREAIELYKGQWISIPIFYKDFGGKTEYGPLNWARIKIGEQNKEIDKDQNFFKTTLLFDTNTQIDPDNDKNENPLFKLNDQESIILGICNVEKQLIKYAQESWNSQELARIAHGDNEPDGVPGLRYLALYIYLVDWLRRKMVLDQIKVFSRKNMINANVDMVIDVGNSRTCALLFDLRDSENPFSNVQKLELNNLSGTALPNQEPFSMRLAFHKVKFGEFKIDSRQFIWPSIVRLGKEAEELIFSSKQSNLFGIPSINNHSSPKRYLWDKEKSEVEWEFIDEDSGMPLFMKGISNQFSSDGSLIDEGDFGTENKFSRKSLMTFCFIEILAHAISQINSYPFRKEHGGINTPRQLRNIIITCPSAMSIEEQKALRKCASDAALALHRFHTNSYNLAFEDTPSLESIPKVIPDEKFIGKQQNNNRKAADWAYDEATCVQMVFLYSEIGKRYLNNFDEYFKLYGKQRKGIEGFGDTQTLTIGSLDIGAGTSDIMINLYKCEGADMKYISPVNLYRESFNLAGDDLVKQIIQNEVINGQLYNALKNIGFTDEEVKKKKDTFFGASSLMNVDDIRRRKDFNVQYAIPLAMKFLELSSTNAEEHSFGFDEIFGNYMPNPLILEEFMNHFGVRFEDIQWQFSPEKVDKIIALVFDGLIRRIATVFFAFGCDFVVLAGRPTKLNEVNKLFIKYFPVPPNRLISMMNYRVGNWYPFQKRVGYYEDPKTIVSVGAMISYLAEKAHYLAGFNVKFDSLANIDNSVSKYIGRYDIARGIIPEVMIDPESNQATFEAIIFPVVFGVKQIDSVYYPSKPMFILDFNLNGIREKMNSRFGDNNSPNALASAVDNHKNHLMNKMPFQVKLSRDISKGLENLSIEEITDNQGGVISKQDVYLKLQTLPQTAGHWMDTGILI